MNRSFLNTSLDTLYQRNKDELVLLIDVLRTLYQNEKSHSDTLQHIIDKIVSKQGDQSIVDKEIAKSYVDWRECLKRALNDFNVDIDDRSDEWEDYEDIDE